MEDELLPCRVCHEDTAYLESEQGWTVYVACANCGSHTGYCEYNTEAEKAEAEKKAIHLWNMGKVIAEKRAE